MMRRFSVWCLTVVSLAGLAEVGLAGPGWASNLNDQLNIQPHNATQGQSRDVADRWVQLGDQQAAEGQLAQATQSWAEAAAIYSALGDTQAQGQVYSSMGNAFVALGQYPQAERAFRLRVGTARNNNDPLGMVFGLNNLGSLQLNQGQLNQGQALFEEALAIARPTEDARAIGLSLSNLGLVASQRGELEQAVPLLEAAANYRLLAGDSVGEAHTSNHLGDVYLALDRTNNAIGAYRVALRLGSEAEDKAIQLRAIDGLLTIYVDRNQWDTAKALLDQRVALTLTNPEPDQQTAITLRWLGDYYYATGDLVGAKDAYTQGLALSRSLGIKSLEAEFTNRLLLQF
jgi:tetratricopeptide (TPR) repeat protein